MQHCVSIIETGLDEAIEASRKAVSMVAGASVLRPYFEFSASMAASKRVRFCSLSEPSKRLSVCRWSGTRPLRWTPMK